MHGLLLVIWGFNFLNEVERLEPNKSTFDDLNEKTRIERKKNSMEGERSY